MHNSKPHLKFASPFKTRTMNIHIVMLFFTLLVFFINPFRADAQTCRMSVGHCSEGVTSFMEVFEYDYVDIKPEFPGGGQSMLNFINKTRHYPSEAYASGIEGRVTCSFVVNSDGSITNISILKGVEESLNEEAVRILSQMPSWIPGKMNEHPVPVRVIYAVPFRK